jgi:hypothetical protein
MKVPHSVGTSLLGQLLAICDDDRAARLEVLRGIRAAWETSFEPRQVTRSDGRPARGLVWPSSLLPSLTREAAESPPGACNGSKSRAPSPIQRAKLSPRPRPGQGARRSSTPSLVIRVSSSHLSHAPLGKPRRVKFQGGSYSTLYVWGEPPCQVVVALLPPEHCLRSGLSNSDGRSRHEAGARSPRSAALTAVLDPRIQRRPRFMVKSPDERPAIRAGKSVVRDRRRQTGRVLAGLA